MHYYTSFTDKSDIYPFGNVEDFVHGRLPEPGDYDLTDEFTKPACCC